MRKTKPYVRPAWTDRFNRPTVAALRAGFKSVDAHLFDDARKRLLEFDGIVESMAWHGENWRWTIEYHRKQDARPVALIVPSPLDLQLAIPLDPEFVRSLPLRRMKRAIRDGLDLAAEPFDTHWSVWSLGAGGLMADLQDLVSRKLQHLARRVG